MIRIKVQISLMGSPLEERWATPLEFRDMLRLPMAKNHGWRAVGDCTFRIIEIKDENAPLEENGDGTIIR